MGALIAVAIIGAALLFLNRQSSPTGTAAADPTPSPTARRTEAPVITPEPELPQFGSGDITFGKSYDPDTLYIVDPTSRFKATYPEIAWSAELTRSVGATSIEWVLASQSASGTEQVLYSEEHDISNVSTPRSAFRVRKGPSTARGAGSWNSPAIVHQDQSTGAC